MVYDDADGHDGSYGHAVMQEEVPRLKKGGVVNCPWSKNAIKRQIFLHYGQRTKWLIRLRTRRLLLDGARNMNGCNRDLSHDSTVALQSLRVHSRDVGVAHAGPPQNQRLLFILGSTP